MCPRAVHTSFTVKPLMSKSPLSQAAVTDFRGISNNSERKNKRDKEDGY